MNYPTKTPVALGERISVPRAEKAVWAALETLPLAQQELLIARVRAELRDRREGGAA